MSPVLMDSSKLVQFMTCPRSYFYRYVLGWREENTSNHLIFGRAWHKAMSFMLGNWYLLNPVELVTDSFGEFLSDYRKDLSEETDDDFEPKSPSKVLEALALYVERYRGDRFEVLHNEIAGTVPISEDRALHFKIDAIVRDQDRGIVLLEHKTGSRFSQSWADQWSLSVQIGTYLHVLHCLYQEGEVWGCLVNGVFFRKTGPPEFVRVPIRRDRSSMAVWFETVKFWAGWAWDEEANFATEATLRTKSDEGRKDAAVMTSFPMNTTACEKYFGCPYIPFCLSWPNPLQRCDEVPLGFVVEFWDPSREDERIEKATLEGKEWK